MPQKSETHGSEMGITFPTKPHQQQNLTKLFRKSQAINENNLFRIKQWGKITLSKAPLPVINPLVHFTGFLHDFAIFTGF